MMGEGGGGVNLNQYCSLAVLFSAIETGLLKWNDITRSRKFQMNKEEREICKLEDNFVSFIDNFIVSFSKYMKILS